MLPDIFDSQGQVFIDYNFPCLSFGKAISLGNCHKLLKVSHCFVVVVVVVVFDVVVIVVDLITLLTIYVLGNFHLSQIIGGIRLSQAKEIHPISPKDKTHVPGIGILL
jgi:hypothetical protein